MNGNIWFKGVSELIKDRSLLVALIANYKFTSNEKFKNLTHSNYNCSKYSFAQRGERKDLELWCQKTNKLF